MSIDARAVNQPEGWQPNDYQRMLLERLGDRDPAESQAETPALIRSLVAEAGDDLRTKPAPSEWSMFECIGHIADDEWIVGARYRWILSHDEPEIAPFDQDLFVDRLHTQSGESIDDLLELFEALRRANLRLWRTSPPADRDRLGIHAERGPESYGLNFRLIGGHDLVHLDQARRALENVRAAR
jgi:hypothetical protein